ncbi:MAG: hypothetical protein RMI89_11875 [Gloeomargarita sp. SKYBB_i_bin120]|nr:hypothetical protein [Gloeomargarita sp. SKYG98]MCS7293644.1 hypothetical protein [Gloeomargarita sp. SKYB120]MDW8179210.1 hypothetical protein [Gloeomargarita sp. SKYBB_i_bin120]
MPAKWIYLTSTLCLMMLPPPVLFTSASPLESQAQGIVGQVVTLQGNFQPQVGRLGKTGQVTPVQTRVWIFLGRIRVVPLSPRWPVAEAAQHPQRWGWVATDDQGWFRVGLPPGEYTLLAESGPDLYLNDFLDDGSFMTVQVQPGRITQVQLENTEKAAF